VKYPKQIKHRGKVLAVIYGKSKSYPLYRVAWSVQGKRRMKAFERFGGEEGANQFAEKLVKDLAKGSLTTALNSAQAADALAALERLEAFRQSSGKRFSLLSAVSEFVEASSKLNGHTLRGAVEEFLRTSISLTRKDIAQAVEEFILAEEPRTKSKNGERAQISAKYAYTRALRLRRFSTAFPNTAVCELKKEHLNTLFAGKPFNEFSAKSRNHYRAIFGQFLSWCVRRDYLSSAHRLGEADAMKPEQANTADVAFYSPKEFRAMLEVASEIMRPIIALCGLAGLRTEELLRLTWEDVFRVQDHIEITKSKAKTRQRRLVEIVPALAEWLEPHRKSRGKLWIGSETVSARRNENLLHEELLTICEKAGVKRKENGLRHAFCTFHFAKHSNENLTAAQAGNSPAMIHAHYKGLATKAEAEKWFSVAPVKPANIIPMDAQETARA
jgi:integrase